jgi:hypothetical protein
MGSNARPTSGGTGAPIVAHAGIGLLKTFHTVNTEKGHAMSEYGYLTYDEGNPAQLYRVLEKWALPQSGEAMVTLQAGDIVLVEYAEAFWPMAEF